MDKKTNVLIFPAGSENGIDIYESLKYNLHFNVFGASGKRDHSDFIYKSENLYFGDLYITDENFFDEFNKVLERFKIEYIIPTHDTIALFIMENSHKIKAKVICSPYETTKIAENKMLTYEALKELSFYPKVYENEVTKFPVFLKPYVGAGAKGTYKVNNKEELNEILERNSNMLISEYLPGKEYTVDCFTNKDGELLFVGPRKRERINMGITFHSEKVERTPEFDYIANCLNEKFRFRGAWFFQVKENEFGQLKLMEFSVRQAGTMAYYRQLGVNFAALSLFDAMGYDVKVIFNDNNLILDRCLKNCYKFKYSYDKLYIDFDDTLIVNNQVNTTLIKLIYQSINAGKKIILLTKHEFVLEDNLKKYRINKELFDDILIIEPKKNKADYIKGKNCIFIDNYFPERMAVKQLCKIPVFDVDAIECLIDSSAL